MDMLVAPNVDVVADSFDRGYDAGFNAGVKSADDMRAHVRYLISCAYADLMVDGVTDGSPIVHDVIEHVLNVVDGKVPARDYAYWGSEVH
jgi:hypothetical protein